MSKVLSFFSTILVLSLVTNTPIFSQVSDTEKQLAQDLVEQAELVMEATAAMDIAREMYVQAATVDPDNIKANYKAGEFHLKTIGKDKAVPYFRRVKQLDPNFRFDISYWIGASYQFGLEFEEAIDNFEEYKRKLESNSNYSGKDKVSMREVDRRIEECKNGIAFVANPKPYSITNLGAEINSEYEDYAPTINKNNDLMIFTTRRKDGNMQQNVDLDNKPFEDVFISTFKDGIWSQAKNIGVPVNTKYHDSNLALSPDGDQLFLYTDDNNGDIMVCDKLDDDLWSEPYPIGEKINSEGYKESSVCLSPDGNVLYFSSDRPGGFGGTDIYYSIKDKRGRWKKAINCGENINTPYDDDGPFVHFTGEYLYFSSKGRNTMGGYDVFRSKFDFMEEWWMPAENMGYPISTPDDDIYFIMTKDGKIGYYASVKDDGFGFTDIYKITEGVPEPPVEEEDTVEQIAMNDTSMAAPADSSEMAAPPAEVVKEVLPVNLTLKVQDSDGEPLSAKIKFTNVDNNMVSGTSKTGDGEYLITIKDADNANFRLSVEKDGYAFINENMSISGSTDEEKSIEKVVTLRALNVGTSKVLRNIYFDFNQASIKQNSFDELSKLEKMMARNPGMEIEIAGHTDNIGDAAFNKTLSQRRVDAVKSYLSKKGVDPRRITTMGYGEERPLASNDDEKEGRELNRRVEFTVTKR